MPRHPRARRRRRWIIAASLLAFGAFATANILARRHAEAFLRFQPAGPRTAPPEQLSARAKLRVLIRGVEVPRPTLARTPADLDLPFTTIEIETEDGETLSVWRIAASTPARGIAVLFHGYAQAKDSLLEAAASFVELGYVCYLVDFRGSGGSSAAYTTLGVLEARDVHAVVDHVERHEGDHVPLLLYGVSMGTAAITRALAVDAVEADALILDAPFDRMLGTVRNRFESMGVPAFPAAELLVFWGGQAFDFDGFAHDPVDYAAAITVPTLIVHGLDDPRARPADVERVYAALAGPKQIVGFAGVGHEPIAVARPDAWRREVEAFSREIGVGK